MLTISQSEYRSMLETSFPREVLGAFMKAVTEGYRLAPKHCRKTYEHRGVEHDMVGAHRRGAISDLIHGVADRFSLECKEQANDAKNTYFTCIFSGNFRLICCLSSGPKRLPRPAKIRRLWAKHNYPPQADFFTPIGATVPENAQHLAVLVHSPRGRHRDEVAFVDILIPDQKFRSYIDRLELFKLFPAEAEQYRKSLVRRRRQEGQAATA